MRPAVTDLSHLASFPHVSSMLLHVAEFPSFLGLTCIHLCLYHIFFIHLSIDENPSTWGGLFFIPRAMGSD